MGQEGLQKVEYGAAGSQKKRAEKELVGAVLATGGGICWGLSGSMGQYLFRCQGMDSRWLVPYRLGLAGVGRGLYLPVSVFPDDSVV